MNLRSSHPLIDVKKCTVKVINLHSSGSQVTGDKGGAISVVDSNVEILSSYFKGQNSINGACIYAETTKKEE